LSLQVNHAFFFVNAAKGLESLEKPTTNLP
jgi:hypothetical protein